MNIVGKYGCDKATLTVEAVDSTTTRMTVYWPTSSLTRTEWTMTGTFNPEKQTIEYSDGTKKAFTFDEKGKLKKETVDYENGTGRFKIDMAASEITWEDDQEKACFRSESSENSESSLTCCFRNSPSCRSRRQPRWIPEQEP